MIIGILDEWTLDEWTDEWIHEFIHLSTHHMCHGHVLSLSPRAHVQGVKWSVMSVCHHCLSVCWHKKERQFSRSRSLKTPYITPRYLPTCRMYNGFSVPRVHYTMCICETTVYFYPQGSTCISTCTLCVGYVLYRALVILAYI